MLESKIRCHWNSDTQGDTTTRPDLCFYLACGDEAGPKSCMMIWTLGWAWQLTLSGFVGCSPGCQVPYSHQPYHVIVSLSSWSSCPFATPWQPDQAFLRLELSTVGPGPWLCGIFCNSSCTISLIGFGVLMYWPPVHPQFLSEPAFRTPLAVPGGWSIGFVPPSSSLCCGPFPGHCPCPGWMSIKLSPDNLHQLNPSPPSEPSGVRTRLVCGEWELLSRLWGHWQSWPSLTWVPCQLVGSEFWPVLLVLAGAEL